jgi:hypothetical protein
MGALRRHLPILDWLPAYDRSALADDAVAGLSVWAPLVPQCLACATIAGVPGSTRPRSRSATPTAPTSSSRSRRSWPRAASRCTSSACPPVLALWRRAGVLDAVGPDAFHDTVAEAVAAIGGDPGAGRRPGARDDAAGDRILPSG